MSNENINEELIQKTQDGIREEEDQEFLREVVGDADKEVAVPLGVFDLDGSWRPNPMLMMTEEEQRQHNIRHGFL